MGQNFGLKPVFMMMDFYSRIQLFIIHSMNEKKFRSASGYLVDLP